MKYIKPKPIELTPEFLAKHAHETTEFITKLDKAYESTRNSILHFGNNKKGVN